MLSFFSVYDGYKCVITLAEKVLRLLRLVLVYYFIGLSQTGTVFLKPVAIRLIIRHEGSYFIPKFRRMVHVEQMTYFMDNYVVFVENNGSRVYHTYDCPEFSKSNFWAYSRKLAEAQGFNPCPTCGGVP